MARNPYIYGLAKNIYVAESGEEGGTWSGVIDGLRKGRIIFVRKPGPAEHNANNKLIEKGALPVDILRNPVGATVERMIAETQSTYHVVEKEVIEEVSAKPKKKGKRRKKKTGADSNDSQMNLL